MTDIAAKIMSFSRTTPNKSTHRIVSVTLVRGYGLPTKDRSGLCDPYCKFRIGSSKHRSSTCHKTSEPQWNEHFELILKDDDDEKEAEQTLKVEVYDWSRVFADTFIAHGTVDLRSLFLDQIYSFNVPLEDALVATTSGCAGRRSASGAATPVSPATDGCIELRLCVSQFPADDDAITEQTNGDTGAASARALLHTFDARIYSAALKTMQTKYSFANIGSGAWGDVGSLAIRVIRACDLLDRDISSKSDPFCVLQLGAARRTTHVIRDDLNPVWNAYFELPVLDLHTPLVITVYDEDERGTHDFLGKLAIPLLSVQNGTRMWYALKNETLHSTMVCGSANETSNHGALLLELNLFYNPLKAAWRSIQPRSTDRAIGLSDPNKFSVKAFGYNVTRISHWLTPLADIAMFGRSIMQWESKPRTLTFFTLYILVVSLFEPWMLPALIFIIFFFNMMRSAMRQQRSKRGMATAHANRRIGRSNKTRLSAVFTTGEDLDLMMITQTEDLATVDDAPGTHKTRRDKARKKIRTVAKRARAKLRQPHPPQTPQQRHSLVEFRNKALMVQRLMQNTADFVEQVENTFSFTVPWLSYGAMLALAVAVVVLYLVNLRIILIAWGLFKITTRLPRPAGPSPFEVYDYITHNWTENDRIVYENTSWPDDGDDDQIVGDSTESAANNESGVVEDVENGDGDGGNEIMETGNGNDGSQIRSSSALV